ncbi:MAG: hypothetical protein LN413_06990, partial [Candidatus Thermoplasmatota archaeon]|nr:hypothetical protein [Candidatus Thermoplasmatota archaeon]
MASLPALAGGIQAFGQAVLTHSPAGIAWKVAWPTMRTFGYITESLTRGLDPRTGAVGRALTMPPFMGSFLSGVAYDSPTEVAEGWLAWWAEAFVPGTLGNRMTFTLVDALRKGDWMGVGDILLDSFAEIKIEEPL